MKIKILIILPVAIAVMASCKPKQQSTRSLFLPDRAIEVSQTEQLASTSRMIDASKQVMLGNLGNAVLLYAEAVKIDPRNSAALYELAKLHAQQGFLKDAEVFARRAVDLDPNNKFFGMLLADIYFAQNKNEPGFRIQQQLSSNNPSDLNIQISFLSTLLHLEKFPEALSHIEYLERLTGFNTEMSLQKQRILLEMKRTDLALAEAMRLVAFNPGETGFLELLAELYTEAGQSEEAYKVYQQMLVIQPDNPMARLLLADYYRNAGDKNKSFDQLALAFISRQLGIEGKARILASWYFLAQEDSVYTEQAKKLCGILLEVHPDEALTYALNGDFLQLEDNITGAREMYLKATSIDPSRIEFWQQLLSVELRSENYENLLASSEKALEYFFEHGLIYFFNGIAHLQLKNYSKAIAAFNAGKNLTFDNNELKGQFLTMLGDTYFKTGEFSQSYKSYEEALLLDPNNAYALNNYSYYLSIRRENLEKALVMSAKSLELQPNNASFQDTFGWIKYKLGDYSQAQIWIKKALDNTETPNAVVLEHYGDVLFKLGQKEEALRYWKKALETKTDDDDDLSQFLEKKVTDGTLYE